MSKYIHMRCVGTNDDGAITVSGFLLAQREGQLEHGVRYGHVFVDQTNASVQTAEQFCRGANGSPQPTQVVPELCDDAWLTQILTPKFHQEYKRRQHPLFALLEAHGVYNGQEFKRRAKAALISMFNAMKRDEAAIAFTHSVVIHLAAFAVQRDTEMWGEFMALDCLVFRQARNGNITAQQAFRAKTIKVAKRA